VENQLTVNSVKFQELIAKANKACTNNKLIPITGLISVSLRNGVLSLKTTDGRNYLTVTEKEVQGDNIDFVTTTNLFINLVTKMTSEKITFILDPEQQKLSVKGNGSYSISLPLNEEGELITWPNSNKMGEVTNSFSAKPANFKKAISTNKSSLAKTLEMPTLTQYYLEDGKVITCDSLVVCENRENVLSQKVLLDPSLMELVSLMPDDEVGVEVGKDAIRFVGKNMELVGRITASYEEYPIEQLQEFFKAALPFVCKVNRVSIMSALDRLNLFVENNDENGITMVFSKKALHLKSKRGSATESIPYEDSLSVSEFSAFENDLIYTINLEKLSDQLSAQNDVYVNIGFGNSTAIRISSGTITQVISLIGE